MMREPVVTVASQSSIGWCRINWSTWYNSILPSREIAVGGMYSERLKLYFVCWLDFSLVHIKFSKLKLKLRCCKCMHDLADEAATIGVIQGTVTALAR